jgi:ankyrin repeat protein
LEPNNPVSNYKFFLRACRNEKANEGIIRCLLEYFPAATSATDYYNGRSPLHLVFNKNITPNVSEGRIRCLLQYFPQGASATDDEGRSPLHCACSNKNITLNIVQLLIDAAPNSVRTVEDNNGWMPIHCLCRNNNVDEIIAIEILKLLVEKCHESVRRASWNGDRPIHYAAMTRSPEFCRVLTFVSWIRTDS